MAQPTTLAAIEEIAPEPTAQFVELMRRLQSEEIREHPLHEVEEETWLRGRELLRLALQSHLRSRGTGDVGAAIVAESLPPCESVEEAGGELVRLSHRRLRHRTYKSRFGWLELDRIAYGQRGESSLLPLDEEVSIPARLTGYPIQKEICTEVARGPYEEAARALERQGVPVAPANVDDIAADAARDFEEFYGQTTPDPEDKMSEILVSAADCKGIRIRGLGSEEPPYAFSGVPNWAETRSEKGFQPVPTPVQSQGAQIAESA